MDLKFYALNLKRGFRYDSVVTLSFTNTVKHLFQATVEDIVQSKEGSKVGAKDDDMVERLRDAKLFIDSTLNTAFADDTDVPHAGTSASGAIQTRRQPNQEFSYAVSDAFQTGFKARRNKPAEMIAKYLDKVMRRGQRGASDADFNDLLDSVLGLYRFTNDKDVFRTFYHRALAKRLLLERSASYDFEKAILKKLKEREYLRNHSQYTFSTTILLTEYDPEFGMGDHMFTDLALSRDTMTDFLSKTNADLANQKLNVMVLQQSVWPFAARKKDADLPATVGSSSSILM